MRERSVWWAVAILFFGVFALSASQPSMNGRYLYAVTCDATVEKLDTLTGALKATPLSQKTRLIPEYHGHLNGCLANGAVLSSDGRFYTAVPTTVDLNEQGQQHYRIISFEIPSLRFVRAVDLPVDIDSSGLPRLRQTANGAVIVSANGPEFLVNDSGETMPLPVGSSEIGTLDLAEYSGSALGAYAVGEGSERKVVATVIETSGDFALVQLLGPREIQAFAVANLSNKHVRLLLDLPSTFPQDVHLAPGGGAVLVEEAQPLPADSQSTFKTGKLLLMDAVTGKRLKEWTVPNLSKQFFLALTPNGKAVYYLNNTFRFVKVGMKFQNLPVERPEKAGMPYFFSTN